MRFVHLNGLVFEYTPRQPFPELGDLYPEVVTLVINRKRVRFVLRGEGESRYYKEES